MSVEAECPVDHEAIEKPHASWMQAAAQDILDGRDVGEALGEYKARLEDSYALMAEHNPGKAAVNVARKVRAAYMAPLGHIYMGKAIECLEERRHAGTLDPYIKHCRKTNFYLGTGSIDPTYHGEAEVYMQIMLALMDDSIISLAPDRESPSGKLFHKLEEYTPHISTMMQYAAAQWDDEFYKEFFGKDRYFYMTMGGLLIENGLISLEQMLGAQSALAEAGHTLTPAQIGETVRNNMDAMVQYGSTNRPVIRQQELFAGSNRQSIFHQSGDDLEPYTNLFVADQTFRRIRPRHGSLKNGPWRSPGNCPADLTLRFTDPQMAEANQSFFNSLGMESCDDGIFQTNTGLLTIGSLAGEHTIFRPTEETPALLLKGMARAAFTKVA